MKTLSLPFFNLIFNFKFYNFKFIIFSFIFKIPESLFDQNRLVLKLAPPQRTKLISELSATEILVTSLSAYLKEADLLWNWLSQEADCLWRLKSKKSKPMKAWRTIAEPLILLKPWRYYYYYLLLLLRLQTCIIW